MRAVLTSFLVSLFVAGLAVFWLRGHPQGVTAAPESVYNRILRTGEIRCGYTVWNPLFFVDPETGEKQGIFHDVMEEIGRRLGLKIVWQEELGWGTVVESVKTGRVDMACAGYWLNPPRIKNIASSAPQLYAPIYVWGRQDDSRVFHDLEDLNSDQYKFVKTDGDAVSYLIDMHFPKAKISNLPEMATNSDLIENVLTGKANFIVVDSTSMAAFIASNPGRIKKLFPDRPLNVFPTVMLLPPDDPRLKQAVDDMLRNIEYDGTLDAILKKYHMENSFLRNPKPVPAP